MAAILAKQIMLTMICQNVPYSCDELTTRFHNEKDSYSEYVYNWDLFHLCITSIIKFKH